MKLQSHHKVQKISDGYYYFGTVYHDPLEPLTESLRDLLEIADLFGEKIEACVMEWRKAHKGCPGETVKKAVEIVTEERKKAVFSRK